MGDRKYDLEDRLVEYGCRMIDVVEALPATRAGNYIAGQLINLAYRRLLITAKFRRLSRGTILFIS
jgi:hypothetical protein